MGDQAHDSSASGAGGISKEQQPHFPGSKRPCAQDLIGAESLQVRGFHALPRQAVILAAGTGERMGDASVTPKVLAVSADGKNAYVASFGSDAVAVFAREL